MNAKEFRSPQAGKCIRTTGGFWAFVPATLPPSFDLDSVTTLALSRADAALGEVAGLTMGGVVGRMHMLIQTFARREAVLSSRIEGTQTQLDDLLMAEVRKGSTTPDRDLREVQNYVRALHEGAGLLKKLPIATRLGRQLHAILMKGVRGGDRTPGEFRKVQNFIGASGDTVESAKYVPPPVEHMHQLLSNWEEYVNTRDRWPDLVQCAIMHEQFEAIHPFQDGNGRVGRLLITLFLMERKRLPQPLLPLSSFIESHRREYYDLLQAVRTDGEWTEWIRYFLAGITHTSRQVVAQVRIMDGLRREHRDKLTGKHRARSLLDELFSNPFTTVSRAAQRLNTTAPTARRSIDLLLKLGILEETTGKAWGRVYVARSILNAMEKPPAMEG